ncbi:hypothetical protein GCM10010401_03370 [Rarobacter faecitabidus]|uniref:GT2 family glycosyltransferase n=1 Tax=Rarobacter faecitabidus TaxID=13243 RepID=A0A542ZUA1_RARFA|nr:glycosyltransferase [Rarobacter faecitabidus]TQL63907.1 GT2 family glycosyltransferase [Rarobacter faecitabidus]
MSDASSSDAPEPESAIVDDDVVALIVARGASPVARRTIRAALSQARLPATLVVVDASAGADAAAIVADIDVPGAVALLPIDAPGAKNFGAAVRRALLDARIPQTEWLWLLHADSAPLPDALQELRLATAGAETVAVAGAKQVMWNEPDRLIEVGYTVSPGGRRLTDMDRGEIDQGQHDGREDVLAVGLAGALVRRGVWDSLRGPDAALGPFRDSLDFCVRVRRAGGRVIVVPTAIVEHAQLALHGAHDPSAISEGSADRSYGARLRSWLYLRAVHAPGVAWLLLPFWYFLAVIPRALWRVAVKQPGQAVDELFAPFWLASRVMRIVLARYSLGRVTRVPRRTLKPLLATRRNILGADRDQRLARAAQRRSQRRGDELQWAARLSELRRQRAALTALVIMLIALSAVTLREPLRALRQHELLVGGALLPGVGTWGTWWNAISSGWNTQSLGSSAPVDPLVAGLAPVLVLTGGSLTAAIALLICLTIVIGGVGAWYAAGLITRSLVARAWAVLAWVAQPAFFAGLSGGHLGALLVHATLPWFALSLALAVGVVRTDPLRDEALAGRTLGQSGRGSLVAVGAAGLFLALLSAAAPVLLLPLSGLVLIAGVAASRRGTAGRGGWWLIPLPAFALLAPLLVRVVATWGAGGWRMLVADPGGPSVSLGGPWWRAAFGVEPGQRTLTSFMQWPLPAAVTIAILMVGLAVAGLLRTGIPARIARAGWLIGALGLTIAAVSSNTAVSVAGGTLATGWWGAGASLAVLGLTAAAVSALSGLGTAASRHSFGWRQVGVGALAIAIVVPMGAALVSQVRGVRDGSSIEAVSRAQVPAVAQAMQRSDRAVRVLAISGTPKRLEYRLLRGDSTLITESSAVVGVASLRGGDDPLAPVVGALGGSYGADAVAQLTRFGIGAVLLESANGKSATIADRIDSAVGMQRMTQGRRNIVWRVVNSTDGADVSWARLATANSEETVLDLPAEGLSVAAVIPAGPADRILAVAERTAPGWVARLNGRELPQVPREDGLLGFAVGSEAGTLTLSYERTSKTAWLAVQGSVFLIFALLALPIRRRTGGDR